jgi:uncharacterized peroxidase-related enzyme
MRRLSIAFSESKPELCVIIHLIIKPKEMTRLKALDPDQATGKTKQLFTSIKSNLGVVPNMMRTMGNSASFLDGYLSLSSALGGGSLGGKIGELIALTVAEANQCNYCLSAHTYLGLNLFKIDAAALDAAREATSTDSRIDAVLKFARILVKKGGHVSDQDVATAKAAGMTDGEIGEVVGHVALNILTNYLNNTANTEIDFPLVEFVSLAHV